MTWVAVGTSAAIGAGIGGTAAAIQGDDILTGALIGGATGAVTGGMGGGGTEQLAPELLGDAGMEIAKSAAPEIVSQAAPELLSQAAPEILEQAAPELLSQVAPAGIEQIAAKEFSAAELQALNQGYADSLAAQGTGVQSAGINNVGFTPSAAQPAPVPTPEAASNFGIKGVGPNPSAPGPFDTGVKPMIQGGDPRYASTMGQLQPSVTAPIAPSGPVAPTPPSNGFMQGFSQFAKDHPFYTGAGIYALASTTGMLDQKGQQQPEEEENYTGPRLSANFRGGPYSEPNVYRPRYAEGGILQAYQSGGPVERMSQMNTAMNPQGGLYPQGMIDKTQYATPTQRPVSAELMMEAPAYERSSPMLMAAGGQVKGYAPGGQINLQGSFNLDQSNMNSQAFPGAATVGSGMAPSTISPMTLPFMGMPATGGPGMGPQNHMYQPQLAVMPQQSISMASGGIASIPRYYRGDLATSSGRRGDVYSATQRFLDMYDPQSKYTPPKGADNPDVGIFRDTSAATRNKSALDAAMTRQAALEKQNYIDTGAKLPRASRSAGQLNMKPQGKKAEKDDEYEYAASGGIMGANLGGYAAGGNPRLLKGPGDGMSDNIPAVIGRRQPARLADGEFVVPADVVSHLGNGSTEAGAKKLHGMMDNVRKARTGKKKQAPAVKANRFIPK